MVVTSVAIAAAFVAILATKESAELLFSC